MWHFKILRLKFFFCCANLCRFCYFTFKDAEVLQRESEAIKVDELNTSQMKELRDKVSNTVIYLHVLDTLAIAVQCMEFPVISSFV